MGNLFIILFIILIFFYAFDVYAAETADVICNVISYIHRIGGLMITVIVIGSSLLAIFGRMPWPALFLLGMFIAVFFGAPQIVTKVTGKEVCCLLEGQMMEDGKCVAAPGYEFVGKNFGIRPRTGIGGGCGLKYPDYVFDNKGKCVNRFTEPV